MDPVEDKPGRESSPPMGGRTLLELWILVMKYRGLVLGSTILLGVFAAIISFFIPNQYTATTSILPPQQNTSLSSMMTAQLGSLASLGAITGGSGLGLKDPNDFYIGMLKSRVVEDNLIQKFNLTATYHARKISLARKALENHSNILSTKDGFISISVEDRDPDRAAEIANAYVDQLQDLRSTIAVTEAGQRRKFFGQQLQDADAKLAVAEQQLKDTQQQTGVLQLDAQTKAVIESVTQLKAQIAAKEVELQVLSSYATDQNPQRVLAVQEVAGLRRQLAVLENKQGGGKGDVQVSTSQIPAIGMTYLNEIRDVHYYETISELLAKQFEVAKLDEAREGSVLQVLDPAVRPDTKSFPSRTLIIALAALLGLLGSIAFVVGRELIAGNQQRLSNVAP